MQHGYKTIKGRGAFGQICKWTLILFNVLSLFLCLTIGFFTALLLPAWVVINIILGLLTLFTGGDDRVVPLDINGKSS